MRGCATSNSGLGLARGAVEALNVRVNSTCRSSRRLLYNPRYLYHFLDLIKLRGTKLRDLMDLIVLVQSIEISIASPASELMLCCMLSTVQKHIDIGGGHVRGASTSASSYQKVNLNFVISIGFSEKLTPIASPGSGRQKQQQPFMFFFIPTLIKGKTRTLFRINQTSEGKTTKLVGKKKYLAEKAKQPRTRRGTRAHDY